MQNQRGNFYLFDALQEVEVTKTFPHLLLDATDHTKRGQITRTAGVGEVARDRQLEGALAVRVRVALAEPRLRQLLPEPQHGRPRLPLAEVGLELGAVGACYRSRIDQNEPCRRRRHSVSTRERLHRVEQREQPTPRI